MRIPQAIFVSISRNIISSNRPQLTGVTSILLIKNSFLDMSMILNERESQPKPTVVCTWGSTRMETESNGTRSTRPLLEW
jgi:hypothetical protein